MKEKALSDVRNTDNKDDGNGAIQIIIKVSFAERIFLTNVARSPTEDN